MMLAAIFRDNGMKDERLDGCAGLIEEKEQGIEVVAITRRAELIIKEMFPLDSSLSISASIRHLYQVSVLNVACLASL